MKAKLTFDLSDFDDKLEHLRCVKATDIVLLLWELTHNSLKEILNKKDNCEKYQEGVEAVFEKIYSLLEEHDININNLIN